MLSGSVRSFNQIRKINNLAKSFFDSIRTLPFYKKYSIQQAVKGTYTTKSLSFHQNTRSEDLNVNIKPSKRRLRKHINPLSKQNMQPVTIEKPWNEVFANPLQCLHLDVGCGKGHYLDELALRFPEWNFLGLDIRKPLVESANRRIEVKGLLKKNIYFQYGNIMTSRSLFESLPCRAFHRVSILFPDPWFKKKHHKRRIVQPQTMQLISEFLVPNGLIFFVTDVEEVAIFSKEVMKSIGSLEEVEGFDFESSEFPIIRIISIPSYAQKPKYSFVFRRKEETEETISKILPSN